MPARAARLAASVGPPNAAVLAVSSASVIETPRKPSRSRSSSLASERVSAAGRSEKAG